MDVFLKSLTDFGHFATQASFAINAILGAAVFSAFVISSAVNGIRRYWWEVKSWQPPKNKPNL